LFLVERLDPDESLNCIAIDIIRKLVQELHPRGGTPRRKVFRLHIENAKPHNSKSSIQCLEDNKLKRLPHPPYSPDVAPSDFYLFGTVKHRLEGCMGETVEDLKENVSEILSTISEEELMAAFLNWMERLQQVIDNGRNDI